MSFWVETFEMVIFEIKIMFIRQKKKIEMTFYCSSVDHFECVGIGLGV